MIRSMLNMDGQLPVEAVLEYHRHLLGEMEALASSALLQGGVSLQHASGEQQGSHNSQSSPMRRSGTSCSLHWHWQGDITAGSNPRPSRLAASSDDCVSGRASGRAGSTARFARFRSSSFLSFLPPRRSSHHRSLSSHCQVPQRKTQQLFRPRFFKAFVRQLPRCKPISCLMHQVRSQMMQKVCSTRLCAGGKPARPPETLILYPRCTCMYSLGLGYPRESFVSSCQGATGTDHPAGL